MPYIGNTIRAADDYRLIDDISSGFNGSATTFALQVAGSAPVPFPKSPQQVLISVNGVIQEPDPTGTSGFNLVGTNIVFSSAPTNGHAFFGIIYATADYLNSGGNFPSGSTGAPSLTFVGDEDTGIYRKGSGSVGFVSNSTEIANTDSNGITISSGNLILGDSGSASSGRLVLGASSDLSIFHSGSASIINDGGNGELILQRGGNDVLSLTSTGIKITDPGSTAQVEVIGFEGSNANLLLTADEGDDNGDKWIIQSQASSGKLKLYNDVSGGNSEVWAISGVGDVTQTGNLSLPDSKQIRIGSSNDLTIEHNGSNSIINDAGTGELQLQRAGNTILSFNDSGIIVTDPTGGATVEIQGFEGGNASLRLVADQGDDNGDVWRVQSNASTNNFLIQNNTSGSMASLWQMSTAGDVTQTGHLSLPNSKEIRLGDSDDLLISHDGANSIINDQGAGNLVLKTNGAKVSITTGGGVEIANFVNNGVCELFHQGHKTLTTNSAGIKITDPSGEAIVQVEAPEGQSASIQLTADEGDDNGDRWKLVSVAGTNTFNIQNDTSGSNVTKWKIDTLGDITQTGHVSLPDEKKIKFGASNDMTIGHISGTNTIEIDSDLAIKHGSENVAVFKDDGDVELYNNNELRLRTLSNGVEVQRNDSAVDCLFQVKNVDTNAASDAIIRILTSNNTAHSILQFGDSGDGNNGEINYDHNAVDMTFAVNASNLYEMDAGAFHPLSNSQDLGRNTGNSVRWDNLYIQNNPTVSSDRNEKNTIVASDLGLDFVNKLNPVSYKLNNGESGRTHYGMIAQDIETLLSEIGKTTIEFAGFVKTTATDDGKGNSITPFDSYSLRYSEFIAPIIKAIQELSAKVSALEAS